MYSRLHLVLRRPVPDALFIQRKAKTPASPSGMGFVRSPAALGLADVPPMLLTERACLADEAFLPAHHASPVAGAHASPTRPSSTDIALQLRHLFVGVGLPSTGDVSGADEAERAAPAAPSEVSMSVEQSARADDDASEDSNAQRADLAASHEWTASSSEDVSDETFVLVTKRHGRHTAPATTQSESPARNVRSSRKLAASSNARAEATVFSAATATATPAYKVQPFPKKRDATTKVVRQPVRGTAAPKAEASTARASVPPPAPPSTPGGWAAAPPTGSVMAAAIAAGVVPARRPLGGAPQQQQQPPARSVRLNPAAAAWQPLPVTDPEPAQKLSAATEAGARPCCISRLPAAQVSGCECRTCFEYAEAAAAEGISVAY